MFLAVVHVPDDGAALLGRAAEATGLALPDIKRRLTGILPRVLLVDVDREKVARTAAALEGLGIATITCDPALVPSDDDRVIARRLQLDDQTLTAFDGANHPCPCPGAALHLIQRGVRDTSRSETVKTTERKVDVGRALLTGGLLISKKVETTHVKTTSSGEPFLLLQRNDGQPDIMLYERRLDYRFLGAAMQGSSHANLQTVLTRLRTLAPAALYDDRVSRPGFTAGLPMTSGDPVDLRLFLVTLAHAR